MKPPFADLVKNEEWRRELIKASPQMMLRRQWHEGGGASAQTALPLSVLAGVLGISHEELRQHISEPPPATHVKEASDQEGPPRVCSVSIVSLGVDHLSLRHPIVVMLENYGDEVIASWPEVEAWGAGDTEAEAINALKDNLVRLCDDLLSVPASKLGKLPRLWAMALRAIVRVERKK
jgi:hypothetical protein